jgi:hypothetical protein
VIRVDKAALREAARQVRGWDANVSGAKTTVDGVLGTYGNGALVIVDRAHNTINEGLTTAKATWTEAFRLASRDLGLLAKILDVGAQHFNLRDDELAALVNGQS